MNLLHTRVSVDPTQPPPPDALLINNTAWFDPEAHTLELSWDPLLVDPDNTTGATVDISVFGYRETSDGTVTTVSTSFNWARVFVPRVPIPENECIFCRAN